MARNTTFVAPLALTQQTGAFTSSSCSRPVLPAVARRRVRPQAAATPRMGLRAVEGYNGTFDLSSDVRDALVSKLTSAEFTAKVAKQGLCESVSFTGDLFQPVPYSSSTPRGMPREMETFVSDPYFMIINVPATVMFEARCFKPSRLCAVFRKFGVPEDVLQQARDEEARLAQLAHDTAAARAQEEGWAGLGAAIRDMFTEEPLTPEEERELDNQVV